MTAWHVRVTFAVDPHRVTEETDEQLLEELVSLRPMVTLDGAAGTLTVDCEIDGETMEAATAAVSRRAGGFLESAGIAAVVRGLHCMRLDEYQRQALSPGVAQFLDLAGTAEAAKILGVRNQQVAQLAKTHADFPRPLEVLAMGPIYSRSEIERWGQGWSRKRTGRPRKQVPEGEESAQ